MTIELGPELAATIAAMAQERGQTPEQFALEVLAERAQARMAPRARLSPEEFRRRLDAIARPCGVSLTNEQLSRETMYD